MNILAKFDLPQRIIWGGYFLLVFAVIVAGDSLYTLYLYPVIVPIVVLEICSWRQPRSFYLCGVAVVLYLSLFCYLSMNWFAAKPEGLLALGHMFSLPGLVVGAIAFAWLDRPSYGQLHRLLSAPWALALAFWWLKGFCLQHCDVLGCFFGGFLKEHDPTDVNRGLCHSTQKQATAYQHSLITGAE